jgi:hypothetical protein
LIADVQLNARYHLRLTKNGKNVQVYLTLPGEKQGQFLFQERLEPPSTQSMYVGLNVWQGSALFNDVYLFEK